MGGSGIAGDVLAAVAGAGSPVPVLTHRGYGLPGWVGVADLVVAVSCSGSTEETLSALEEAVRRGVPVLVVGADGSPVHDLAQRGRGVFVPATQGRQPRASVWSLSTPLLVAGDGLGVCAGDDAVVEAAAKALEQVASSCRIDAEELVNPAKQLATHLRGAVPVLWGTSPLAGVAAYRFACQLNENAKTPATWGVLPRPATTRSRPSTARSAAGRGPAVRATTTATTCSATAATTWRSRGWRWCCCATPRSTRRPRGGPTSAGRWRGARAGRPRGAGRRGHGVRAAGAAGRHHRLREHLPRAGRGHRPHAVDAITELKRAISR
jgi:D-arabinose 5-phosphate isomerase GutQ